MKVTTKGQVTIPSDVRQALGIHPGSEVHFSVEGKKAILTATKSSESLGKRVVNHLRGRATSGLTTDEIMAMTRGE